MTDKVGILITRDTVAARRDFTPAHAFDAYNSEAAPASLPAAAKFDVGANAAAVMKCYGISEVHGANGNKSDALVHANFGVFSVLGMGAQR